MRTILITGVSGFIGQNLALQLRDKYIILGIDVDKGASGYCDIFFNIDITNYKPLIALIKKYRPDIIIHTAAMKNLKQCEIDQKRAYEVNTQSVIILNNAAKKINAKFVFISSDQVFHGDIAFSNINSTKKPINYYGLTKSISEEEVIKNPSAAICRTALVFGKIPENQIPIFIALRNSPILIVQGYIANHVYYRLKHNKIIYLSADEYCNPTSVDILVQQIKIIIDNNLKGIFHCCGGERISRYEFGKKIAIKLSLNKQLIHKSQSNDPLRPKDVSLDVAFSQKALGFKFPSIDKMLDNIEVCNDS